MFKEIKALITKDIKIEWRQRYAINGLLLYVAGAIFIVYMSFNLRRGQLSPITWNALFWIILVFAAFNAVSKSFIQESSRRLFYYYQLADPRAIILAKMIYNSGLMVILSFVAWLFFALVLGNPVTNNGAFCLSIVLGGGGLALSLTMVSSIASRLNNNSLFMGILGFPIVLPIILMALQIAKNAIDGLPLDVSSQEIFTLLAVDMIAGSVSLILFPFLWRS